jgi:hypothetical protein
MISNVEAAVTADIVQQVQTIIEITRRPSKQSTEVLIATDAYDFANFGARQQPTSSDSSFELVSPSSGQPDSSTLITTPTTTPSKLEEEGFVEVEMDLQSVSSTETEPTTIVENVPQTQQQEALEVGTPTDEVPSEQKVEQQQPKEPVQAEIQPEQQQQKIKEESQISGDFELIQPVDIQEIDAQIKQQQQEVGEAQAVKESAEPSSKAPTEQPKPAILESQTEVNVHAEFEPSSLTSSLSDAGQAPKFRLALAPTTFRCGRAAQLKCIVTGLPNPDVRWFVDGDQIVNGL